MGILSWIVLGIIAGALAKIFMPGPNGGGLIRTMILGIVGAFVGGFIGQMAGIGTVTGFNMSSIIVATVGAFIVLAIGSRL